ncbi:MAG: PilZ domain-containing protein [Desulfobulbaceae bacterium]|nr:PilZ domain-containing protein [Desulfobulbaceae bacterium]
MPTKKNIQAESEEKRRHQRFPIKSATISTGNKSGEIIDISMGGLAFSYLEREDWTDDTFDRGMLLGEQDLRIEDIQLKVISDCAINSGFSVVRRCGVKFEQLTAKQLAQLEYFIWANTIASDDDGG